MNNAPRLLHVLTVPLSLGFLRGQLRFMKEQGMEIAVITSPGHQLFTFCEREGVAGHPIAMPRRITPLQDLTAVLQLWRQIRRMRPSIVHSHTPKGGLLGTIAAWLAGVPVRLYHMRGLPFMTASGWKRNLLKITERISCALAHRVLCVSHSIRETAVKEGICPPEKITVLLGGSGNGVDATGRFNPESLTADAREEVRQRLAIPDRALVIGFMGRIVRDKGVVELAEAWKALRKEFPNLHLLLVGEFEVEDPIPTALQQDLRATAGIHLTGHIDEPARMYAAMDVLALPTYREGFPNVPLEAAAMRVPVVATRIPGCIDAVQDGVTGSLVPAQDVDALTQALRVYLQQPALRERVGRAARERVLSEFAQERIWRALHQQYVELLATAVGPH